MRARFIEIEFRERPVFLFAGEPKIGEVIANIGHNVRLIGGDALEAREVFFNRRRGLWFGGDEMQTISFDERCKENEPGAERELLRASCLHVLG